MESSTQRELRSAIPEFVREMREVLPALELWATLRIQGPLRRRLDPEDVVQEACMRAYASWRRFDGSKGSFRAWVFGVANNVLLQELRTLRRRPRGAPEDELGPMPSEQELQTLSASLTSITSAAARRECLAALGEEIERLDEEDRWLLVYRGLEELPFEEVAARLGIHLEAARTRYRRLLLRLRYSTQLVRFAP